MVAKNNKKPPPKKRPSGPDKTPRSSVGRVFLIFLISACMFTLGVFVGRGTAPVRFDIARLQKELAELREVVVNKEQQQAKVYRKAINSKSKLGFYEALKTPEPKDGQPDRLEIKAPKPPDAQKPAPSAKGKKTPAAAADERTGMSAAESRKPFTIQVASVREVNAADAMVARLKRRGYPARRVMAKVPGKGVWCRVRVGQFASRADAADTMARLEKDKIKGMVVQQ